ncbi:MAG: biofilm PGA synthesis N-glycosyltransferase PgaC [Marivirga sp.]|jgi:biofilm PGA synthesis N-glycosyltransferase PgaC
MLVIFWCCLGIVLYTYLGYPMVLIFFVKIKRLLSKQDLIFYVKKELPEVDLVIACYNEADILEDKIRNTLAIDYPSELINIHFVTDGSNDESGLILSKYAIINHLHSDERKGKNAAINRVLPLLKSSILIFCDANTFLNKEAIFNIVRHYKDPKVGAVAGEKRVFSTGDNENAGAGEGAYWKYESQLKKWDSELYSVVGAAGELFSVRKNLMDAVPDGIIIEDFYLSVKIAMNGFKVRYEPEAYAMEAGSSSIAEERKRKVRISAGGLQAVAIFFPLLNFFKYGLFSFQYISHRFLRWTLAPLSLLLLIITNVALVYVEAGMFYWLTAVGQLFFYLLAFIGNLLELSGKSSKVFLIPFYFVFMNLTVYQGFLRLVKGKQSAVWEKSKRAKLG